MSSLLKLNHNFHLQKLKTLRIFPPIWTLQNLPNPLTNGKIFLKNISLKKVENDHTMLKPPAPHIAFFIDFLDTLPDTLAHTHHFNYNLSYIEI